MLLPSPAQGCPPCTVQGTERERGRAEGRGREMSRAHVSWTRMGCPSTLPSCLPCATHAHSRTHFMQLCVWRPHVPHFLWWVEGKQGEPCLSPNPPGALPAPLWACREPGKRGLTGQEVWRSLRAGPRESRAASGAWHGARLEGAPGIAKPVPLCLAHSQATKLFLNSFP